MTTDKDLTSFHEGRERLAAARTQEVRDKAEKALADLLKTGERISVTTVARAAGIGRSTLHGEAYKDIYDNIRQAMAEQPLPGSQRIARTTTERGYQAKIMDLHQQLTEAKKQNEELARKAAATTLTLNASPTSGDLDDRDNELAHLRAKVINLSEEIKAANEEIKRLHTDALDKQERLDKLIRDNTELTAENLRLNTDLKAAKRKAKH